MPKTIKLWHLDDYIEFGLVNSNSRTDISQDYILGIDEKGEIYLICLLYNSLSCGDPKSRQWEYEPKVIWQD